MRILGIDPGLERVGFGLIERDSHQQYHALDWGVIKTSANDHEADRLNQVYEAMTELLKEFRPDRAAVEQIFFFKNAKTIIPVSQARGVILIALQQAGLKYSEYTPMQVKLNMTGYGKSTKIEIQEMVQTLLRMKEMPKPDDAADALAIALSCAFEEMPASLFAPSR